MQGNEYHANFYNKYEKHDYHVINIIDVEWCVLPKGSNHHSELMHPQIKQATFVLFIGIGWTCWLGNKGNNNQVSLMKFYAKFVYSINLEHSKFMNESTKTL